MCVSLVTALHGHTGTADSLKPLVVGSQRPPYTHHTPALCIWFYLKRIIAVHTIQHDTAGCQYSLSSCSKAGKVPPLLHQSSWWHWVYQLAGWMSLVSLMADNSSQLLRGDITLPTKKLCFEGIRAKKHLTWLESGCSRYTITWNSRQGLSMRGVQTV